MGTPSRRKRRSNQARITRFFQRDAVIRELEIARRSYYMLNLEQAEQALRKALRIETGHPEATILLSDLLLKAGKPREAYSLLLESVRANPKEALLYLELAQAALHVGRLPEAEKAVLKFLAILDRHPTQLRGERTELTLSAKRILRSLRQHAPADSRQEQATPREPVQRSLFSRAPAFSGRVVRPASTAIVDTAHPIAPPSSSAAGTAVGTAVSPAGNPRQLVRFDDEGAGSPAPPAPRWIDDPWSEDLDDRELLLESQRIGLLSHYEELLCLDAVTGVRRLEFQVETARKILRRLNGRALLCDEVGLGKTIEAGMVIKEYLMRGLVRSVLVLAPPGLVQQWRDEMSAKFSLPFTLWGDRGVSEGDTDGLLLTIGSIASARMGRNRDLLTEKEWDLVVVDEAHHLRRRSTRSWTLVNGLRKRFLLLLSATPVHGDLMELYELVTLVRPGLLGTPAEFRRRFLADARGRRAKDPEKLREILSEVMVRNTRSHADVVLPKRFATTLVLQPGVAEANACRAASTYARLVYSKLDPLARTRLRNLLGCAGSGPRAVGSAAARWLDGCDDAGTGDRGPESVTGSGGERAPAGPEDLRPLLEEIVASARAAGSSVKAARLLEMARASSEQMVVFCRFRATVAELSEALSGASVQHEVYHGALARAEKDRAIEAFRSGSQVLLSTESGGEGRNIQFCRTVINYDLPWDPMLIEQRIGRVHRIGQQRDVFVFNFVLAGTLEEELLRILDEKIHLFELIVGEVDSILGHLDRREEFADILLDLWAGPGDDAERSRRFESFGRELEAARASYEKERALDESLFRDDLEV